VKTVLSRAALFVGNDSGPAHMAAAFGIPSVVLFGPSDPVVWAPWRAPAEQIVAGPALRDLPVSRVVKAALSALQVAA
jgi:heptosyltransferase III